VKIRYVHVAVGAVKGDAFGTRSHLDRANDLVRGPVDNCHVKIGGHVHVAVQAVEGDAIGPLSNRDRRNDLFVAPSITVTLLESTSATYRYPFRESAATASGYNSFDGRKFPGIKALFAKTRV
jgi:hypothetical protein